MMEGLSSKEHDEQLALDMGGYVIRIDITDGWSHWGALHHIGREELFYALPIVFGNYAVEFCEAIDPVGWLMSEFEEEELAW